MKTRLIAILGMFTASVFAYADSGIATIDASPGPSSTPVALQASCETLRKQTIKEIRSELGVQRIEQISASVLRALSATEKERLAIAVRQMSVGVDPFWNLFNENLDHAAFREVGSKLFKKLKNKIKGAIYLPNFNDNDLYARFQRTVGEVRETILFKNPYVTVGRRFLNPQKLNATRYAGILDISLRKDYDPNSESSKLAIFITKNDADGNPEMIEMSLDEFAESFLKEPCKKADEKSTLLPPVVVEDASPVKALQAADSSTSKKIEQNTVEESVTSK